MTNSIQDTISTLWQTGRKTKPSTNSWIAGNAPCCVHNGESGDTRGRGGLMLTPDGGIVWHCFNCQYKTGWAPGRHLSYKFRKLMLWLGADDLVIKRLVIEALRIKDTIAPEIAAKTKEEYVVKPRSLPKEAVSFSQLVTFHELNDWRDADQFHDAVTYIHNRKIDLKKYEFFITPETQINLHKRVLIPFYYKGQVIGYTGRAFDPSVMPKYHNCYENNVVFNMDNQRKDSKFVLVMEGPFDAMAIDGIAVCGDHISEVQADLIESLGKEVIVVPDFDMQEVNNKRVWTGERLVNLAIEYGWSVAYPIWNETCKDVSSAVEKYGKLFTLKTIIDSTESSKLKIELLKRRVHK